MRHLCQDDNDWHDDPGRNTISRSGACDARFTSLIGMTMSERRRPTRVASLPQGCLINQGINGGIWSPGRGLPQKKQYHGGILLDRGARV
jgi:hypothetical protein